MGIGAGLVALGTWAAGAIGVTVTSGLIAGAIGGALVGAAIGGISAAITGGSIGKGILFGAIGGAITGGFAGYGLSTGAGMAAEGGISAATNPASQSLIAAEGVGWGTTVNPGTAFTAAEGASSVSAGLKAFGADMGKQVGGEFVKEGIKGYMAAGAAEDQREFDAEQSALAHQRNLETIAASGGGGGSGGADNTGAELAFKARMAELDQRKHEFKTNTDQTRTEWDTEMDRRETRQGLFKKRESGGYQAPSATGEAAGGIQEKRQVQGIEDVQSQGALSGPDPIAEEQV